MNTWWILTWFCAVCIGQVSESGVHRPHVAGIHGRSNDGAYSLVLAGGYEDDVVCVRTLAPNHPSGSPSLCLPVFCFVFSFHSRTMVMSSPTLAPGVATCLGTRERPSSPAIRSSPTWTGQKRSTACSRQRPWWWKWVFRLMSCRNFMFGYHINIFCHHVALIASAEKLIYCV